MSLFPVEDFKLYLKNIDPLTIPLTMTIVKKTNGDVGLLQQLALITLFGRGDNFKQERNQRWK